MIKELKIGNIKLPLSSSTKTFAILAKRGAGKTYTACVMAEEMHKVGIPFVVFDPIDVWWGLRFDKDGKKEGLPIVVFGLENADIKLERDMGVRIAQAVVKHNISCIISTFGLPKVAQRHLIQEFSEELLRINNTPRHIFVEEVHEFVPQRVFGAMGKVFAAVEALVVMGRNRGIGVTLINQRAATINKDVLTQLDTLIALRNVSPQDRKALKDWVEVHSAEENFERFMKSLPSLPTGECWIWSPEFLNIFKRIKIRERETFHPDREKTGKIAMPKLNKIDIQMFIDEFQKEKVEEKKLKKTPEKVQKPIPIPEPQINIQEIRNEYESKLIAKNIVINNLRSKLRQIGMISGEIMKEKNLIESSAGMGNETNLMLNKLGGMTKKIYETLLKHLNGLTRRQIGLMTGYSSTSGGFSNAMSKLKTMGLVKKEGEVYRVLLK